jgi:hypothetical protein
MRGYGSLYDGSGALLLTELVASGESADGDDESVSIANRRQCAPGAARLRACAARGAALRTWYWVRLGGALGSSAVPSCGQAGAVTELGKC